MYAVLACEFVRHIFRLDHHAHHLDPIFHASTHTHTMFVQTTPAMNDGPSNFIASLAFRKSLPFPCGTESIDVVFVGLGNDSDASKAIAAP